MSQLSQWDARLPGNTLLGVCVLRSAEANGMPGSQAIHCWECVCYDQLKPMGCQAPRQYTAGSVCATISSANGMPGSQAIHC